MEIPESIRNLQTGKWVTFMDFKDAYFHIPINPHSRKYLCFHVQSHSYQFKALLFGMSTASEEFTTVVKEFKLMAQNKGKRSHRYLDDWSESLSHSDSSNFVSGSRLDSKHGNQFLVGPACASSIASSLTSRRTRSNPH